ncbi:C-type lectin BML-2-like [Macrobrachium nipponense]|uniref:C-type lectin BML-2-like n=1 Tax=Macrobrachium nipponense TaxID=159736 RepID=UPI0030C7E072
MATRSLATALAAAIATATCLLVRPAEAIVCELPYEDIGGKCLFVDPLVSDTWYNMRLFCRTLGAGGELVKIDSANLLADIIAYIKRYHFDSANYWIGANDEDFEQKFKWQDGTAVPTGSPFWRYECDQSLSQRPLLDTTRNCAALDMDAHFLLSDFPCLGDDEVKFSPICEAI